MHFVPRDRRGEGLRPLPFFIYAVEPQRFGGVSRWTSPDRLQRVRSSYLAQCPRSFAESVETTTGGDADWPYTEARLAARSTVEQERKSDVQLATTILQAPVCLDVHRTELLSICIWKWTEADAKYRRCRWWSATALHDADSGDDRRARTARDDGDRLHRDQRRAR